MERRCGSCEFFVWTVDSGGEPRFQCRRWPPGLVMRPSGTVARAFPQVSKSEWCGEWAPAGRVVPWWLAVWLRVRGWGDVWAGT